jgi:hypothetical protein
MTTSIFLVGNKEAPKTNSWEYMTNDKEQVEVLLNEPEMAVWKEVIVQPPKRRRRGNRKK